jgi:hypothetical protein
MTEDLDAKSLTEYPHSSLTQKHLLSNSNIAFGTSDQQWLPAYPMNQSTFQSAITNGLNYTDNIVWAYAENNDYLTPGGVNQILD